MRPSFRPKVLAWSVALATVVDDQYAALINCTFVNGLPSDQCPDVLYGASCGCFHGIRHGVFSRMAKARPDSIYSRFRDLMLHDGLSRGGAG